MQRFRFGATALVALVLAGCVPQSPASPVTQGTPDFRPTPMPTARPSTPSPRLTPNAAPPPQPTLPPTPQPTPQPSLPVGAVNWPVPFAPQAPYAVWDELHNEACEEASMIMADAYFKGKPLGLHLMEQGILNLVKWQTQNGYTVDVTAEEVVAILRDYFQLPARLLPNPTGAVIRAELDAGRLVIVPAAGRRLGNPYYRRPGPLYHMLVIRGYDARTGEFITNDPGTKRGEGYRYREQVLLSANHDWPKRGKTKADVTDAEMEAGARVVVVVGE